MMKTNHKIYSAHHRLLSVVLLAVALFGTACTKNFEKYNTDPTGLSPDQLKPDRNYLGLMFPQIQSSIYYNYNNTDWEFQLQQNLGADVFSGYMMSPNPFSTGITNFNYGLREGWNGTAFTVPYNNVMAPVTELARLGARKDAPDFWGIALILKVEAMHRVTDVYGPIPYSKYGASSTAAAYDSQEEVYSAMFKDLDTALTNLKAFTTANPGKTPYAKFDMVYKGDYKQWIKFANSLRLRLAIRISYANATKAKAEVEKSLDPINGGVLTANTDNMLVSGYGLRHPLRTMIDNWSDMSINASLQSYMAGFKDPRIGKYMDSTSYAKAKGKYLYLGIRGGCKMLAKPAYSGYSTPNFKDNKTFTPNTPIQLMTSAEVYFLRAEAALKGWTEKASPQELYEKGVQTSMEQWGTAAGASAYLNDAVSTPAAYVDPQNAANNAPVPSTITVKWDNAASDEEKLERIITQKWIAMFPEGQEAWSEFRRTTYPKIFPPVENYSNNTINTDIQIRRLPFPSTEYTSNKAEVEKAVQLLGGGADNGGTRLWWDKKP